MRQPCADFVRHATDFGCHPLCLAHETFGLELVDVSKCSFCGATQEPEVSASYVARYSALSVGLQSGDVVCVTWRFSRVLGGLKVDRHAFRMGFSRF